MAKNTNLDKDMEEEMEGVEDSEEEDDSGREEKQEFGYATSNKQFQACMSPLTPLSAQISASNFHDLTQISSPPDRRVCFNPKRTVFLYALG